MRTPNERKSPYIAFLRYMAFISYTRIERFELSRIQRFILYLRGLRVFVSSFVSSIAENLSDIVFEISFFFSS